MEPNHESQVDTQKRTTISPHKVTSFLKALTISMLIFLPIVGFYLGIAYKTLQQSTTTNISSQSLTTKNNPASKQVTENNDATRETIASKPKERYIWNTSLSKFDSQWIQFETDDDQYTSDPFKFSFSLPTDGEISNYYVNSQTMPNAVSRGIGFSKIPTDGYSHYILVNGLWFSVSISSKDPNISFEKYADSESCPGKQEFCGREYFKQIKVNNINGFEAYLSQAEVGRLKKIFLEIPSLKDTYILVHLISEGENKDEYNKLVDKILSTFKITN